MWNLLKSVFRSLKHNKVATIGLTFLVFLSTATFTVLNSTTTNINNQYNRIKSEGNLHDITVSELYNNADPKLTFNLEKTTGEPKYWGEASDSTEDKPKIIPWPKVDGDNKTWWFTLDTSNLDDTTPLKIFFEAHKNEESYKEMFFPHITITNKVDVEYIKDATDYKSKKTFDDIWQEISDIKRNAELQNKISEIEFKILSHLKIEASPMEGYFETLKKDNKLESFKKINSINISNSQDQIYYKVVQSNPTDTVDKLVMFSSSYNGVGRENFNSSDWNIKQALNGIDIKEIENLNASDIVSFPYPQYSKTIDKKTQETIRAKFKIFALGDSTERSKGDASNYNTLLKNLSTKNWIDSEFEKAYADWMQYFGSKEFVSFDEYRISANYNLTPPINWHFENWTSYFSVFSPSHLGVSGKKPINIEKIFQLEKFIDWNKTHADLENNWNKVILFFNSLSNSEIYEPEGKTGVIDKLSETCSESVVNIDNSIPVIVLGGGITPDYIYPIVSLDRPLPNVKDECVLFANSSSYKRIQSAFRGSQTEDYLVAKLPKNINNTKIIDEINKKGKEILSWPTNIDCAYAANDTSNVLNASSFRIAYIPSFVEKVNVIDYFLTMFVVILGVLISLIVIRRYISNNRVNIGIMQANGITKNKIAFSLSPFSLIPALAGGIFGYVVGSLLQGFTLGLFSAYWVVPTPLLGFSWAALIGAIAIPFLLFTAASYISTFVLLKEKAVNLMKYGSEYKANIISRFASKPFSALNVLTKFRISFAFNSMWRLLILCVMVALTMSTFVFGLAFDNKFEKSLTATANSRDYEYAVDLYTPTTQGGQYIPVDSNSFGLSGFQKVGNANEEVFIPSVLSTNDEWPVNDKTRKNYYDLTFLQIAKEDDKKLFEESLITEDGYQKKYHGNILAPMLADSISTSMDVQYLRNKVSTKTIMDFEVGIPPATANPWEIAKSLMPDNSINLSEQNAKKLINAVGKKALHDETSVFKSFKDFFKEPNPNNFEINTENILENLGMPGMGFYFRVKNEEGKEIVDNFIRLLLEMYEKENIENGENGINFDYSINYNFVPIDSQDETYTYLTINGLEKNGKRGFHTDLNSKILGVKAYKNGATTIKTEYVNLVDKDGKDLIPLITYDERSKDVGYPIVINEYAARKNNVHIGDKLTFEISNTADRTQRQINGNNEKKKITFKVVGINESFTGEEYFTNQDIANYILGLKSNIVSLGNAKMINNYVDFSWFNPEEVDKSEPKKQGLIDLSNINGQDYSPYGFNGVFTKKENGGRLLSKSISLYSPSGIWPATDKITSSAFKSMLDYSTSSTINPYLAMKLAGFENTQIGKDIETAYNAWKDNTDTTKEDELRAAMNQYNDTLINEIAKYFGQTAYVGLTTGVVSASANEIVFMSMSTTINSIEQIIIIVITLMVALIVMLITSIIISDSKKMAGLLKALGYTDKENTITFLSTYLPVIGFGLILAIPLSIGIVSLFQTAIFTGAKILLSTSIEWWFFPAGILLVVGLLMITAGLAYDSIKKERLVDLIK